MLLDLPLTDLEGYKSRSQRARVATEAWAEANVYCPNCSSPKLARATANTPAIDFRCPQCEAPFQLKAQSRALGNRIVDAAYGAMLESIRHDRTPNLLALHYEPVLWTVRNLILIPHFAFSQSVLEKRKPLGRYARRAGWVGCSILLSNIPSDARIPLLETGAVTPPEEVRRRFRRLKPLAGLKTEKRGWTLDVLNAARSLEKPEFTLTEIYGLEPSLARLHPDNRHIRDKIRQQLQVLRDLSLLEFVGGGHYRLL